MTITSGMVPANPTRRFKNWKMLLQDSAMKVRRRNFLRSRLRGNHGFGERFLPSHLSFGLAAATAAHPVYRRVWDSSMESKAERSVRTRMGRRERRGHATSRIQCLRKKCRKRQAWRRPNSRHRQPFQGQHFDRRYWHGECRAKHAFAFSRRGQRAQSAGARSRHDSRVHLGDAG